VNLIKVDMTHSRIATEPFSQNKLLGGRATIDYWMIEYVSPTVHHLSGENPLIVAVGLLAGTSADKLPDWMRTEPLPPVNAIFDVPEDEIDEFFNF